MMALHVDDTLYMGQQEEPEWMYKEIQKKFKDKKLHSLKKYLGLWYEWKIDIRTGEL
jgi:hypothetical protein